MHNCISLCVQQPLEKVVARELDSSTWQATHSVDRPAAIEALRAFTAVHLPEAIECAWILCCDGRSGVAEWANDLWLVHGRTPVHVFSTSLSRISYTQDAHTRTRESYIEKGVHIAHYTTCNTYPCISLRHHSARCFAYGGARRQTGMKWSATPNPHYCHT